MSKEYMKPIPGKFKNLGAVDTDLKTLLGYTGAALNTEGKNDGRSQIQVSTVMIDGEEYSLSDILQGPMNRIAFLEEIVENTAHKGVVTDSSGATGVTMANAALNLPLEIVSLVKATRVNGEPAFATPLAITGLYELTVNQAWGDDDEEDYVFTPSQAMYGLSGAEDEVTNGQVEYNTKHIVLTGAEAWTAGENEIAPYVLTLSDKVVGTGNFLCSHSATATSGTTPETCVGHSTNKTITFHPNAAADYNTLTKWKALLALESSKQTATPVQLVYQIAPVTESVPVQEIVAKDAAAKITHDGVGDVTVTYFKDMNLVIDDILSQIGD